MSSVRASLQRVSRETISSVQNAAGPSRLPARGISSRSQVQAEKAASGVGGRISSLMDTLQQQQRQQQQQQGENGAASAGAGSSPSSGPTAKIPPLVMGQHYEPSTFNIETYTSHSGRRVKPLLGPSRADAVKIDLIHQLQLHPGHPSLSDDSYKNPPMLSHYLTEMGKIKTRALTGFTRRSQREVGKAIRRARSMGLLPTMSNQDSAGWKLK